MAARDWRLEPKFVHINSMNPGVDVYLEAGCGRCSLGGTPACKVHKWTEELKKLRALILSCGLTEELKWGVPCYTFRGKNVVAASAFKKYCALSFFKGSLLKDGKGILSRPGENSQASRLIGFVSVQEVAESEATLRAYILEAIEVEKAGLKVDLKEAPEPIPNELQLLLVRDPTLKAAFEALTPGRKRGYILHFSQPKQSRTRTDRIKKCVPKILNGEGLNDKYKLAHKNPPEGCEKR